jgi:hypothetical protein
MSPWLILLVMIIYAVIAIDLFIAGNKPMAAVFAGYAFSNIGLWASSR